MIAALITMTEIYNNPFIASGDFCRLLITFANSLDQNQDRQNFSPDLDPNYFTLVIVILKDFLKKFKFDKKSADDNKMKTYPELKS